MGIQDKLDWLSQFKPRIVKTMDMLSYDEYIYDSKNELDGHLPKNFFRVPSSKFPDLFREIQTNPHCSYVTYCNDVAKDGMVPEYVSAMRKSFGQYVYHPEREAVVSKLLNYMGVPTTYNLVVKHSVVDGEKTAQGNNEYEVLSVDCISKNETFESFKDAKVDSLINIYGAIEQIKSAFSKYEFESWSSRKQNLNEVIEDFVLTYLVRGYLLGDNDFRNRNLGLLYNSEKKHVKLVNFDYEQCFMADINVFLEDYAYNEEPIFLFAKQEYPNVYKKFMSIVETFRDKLSGLREIDLMRKFNKNFSEILIMLKQNTEAISKFDQKLEKKLDKYGKISNVILNAKAKLKKDWSGM